MSVFLDNYGVPYTARNQESAAGFQDAIKAFMGFRRDIGDRLMAISERDPDMPMLICIKGYIGKLMGCRDMSKVAEAQLAILDGIIAENRPLLDRELRHIEALRLWSHGHLDKAAEAWEEILVETPLDGLALRLAHFAWFYSGDGRRIRDSMARALPFWPEDHPCYGNLLGMYAFGLEESGDYARAERFGRRAVEIDPEDAWSVHAVSHTMEMTERHDAGVEWIEGLRSSWSAVNNFRFHLDWHVSLFHMEKGDYDRVLELYDEQFGADVDSNYYLDFCNAASALWRLEIYGVDTGERWSKLVGIARNHIEDRELAFLSLHHMMALVKAGAPADTDAMMESFRRWSETDNSQGRAIADAGLDIAQAMLYMKEAKFSDAAECLLTCRYDKDGIGGSMAQRDLFDLMLLQAARDSGRLKLARTLFAERINLRPGSQWSQREYDHVLASMDASGHLASQDILENRL